MDSNNDSKKIAFVVIAIFVLMLTTTGGTYAYLALGATAANTVSGTVASGDLGLTVSVVAPTSAKLSSSTGVMVPQQNASLATAINSTNLCVDGNNNVVCYVLQITIKNNSTARVVVNGDMTFTNGTTNLSWKPLTNGTSVNTTTYGTSFLFKATNSVTESLSTNTANSRLVVSSLTLNPKNSTTCTTAVPTSTTTSNNPNSCVATYFVVVWINETNAVQSDSGTWRATVSFNSSNGTGVTSTITPS